MLPVNLAAFLPNQTAACRCKRCCIVHGFPRTPFYQHRHILHHSHDGLLCCSRSRQPFCAIRVQSSLTTISTPPSLDNRFCPNIAIASFFTHKSFPQSHSINSSSISRPTQRADRLVHLSAGCHPTLMVEISFWMALLPPKKISRSFLVRKYELQVAEPFVLCRTLVPIMTAAYYISSPAPFNGRNRLLTDSLVLRFTSIVIFRTAHMMSCSVVACHLTALLRHPCAQLFCHDLHAPLDHLLWPKTASLNFSFIFPFLSLYTFRDLIPIPCQTPARFPLHQKKPGRIYARFLTDLRRNSLTFYFQNHQYQFRKCRKRKGVELVILLSYQSQHVRISKANTSCHSAGHLRHF